MTYSLPKSLPFRPRMELRKPNLGRERVYFSSACTGTRYLVQYNRREPIKKMKSTETVVDTKSMMADARYSPPSSAPRLPPSFPRGKIENVAPARSREKYSALPHALADARAHAPRPNQRVRPSSKPTTRKSSPRRGMATGVDEASAVRAHRQLSVPRATPDSSADRFADAGDAAREGEGRRREHYQQKFIASIT